MTVEEHDRRTVSLKLRLRPAVAKALEELASTRGVERVAIVSELILSEYSKSTGPRSGPLRDTR